MNLNKVDEVWNEFSKLNNVDLKHKERSLANVTQSNYLINYTSEVATFSFIGMLSKSAEGHYTDRTSIIVEYQSRLGIDNFELKNIDEMKDLLSENITTDFGKRIFKKLKTFKGNSITLKHNFIRIDTDHIFSTLEEFEHVTDLISELKD